MRLFTRRTLLAGGAGTLAIAGAGLGAAAFSCGWSESRRAGAEQLFAAVPDVVDPEAIGAAYLAENGGNRIAREFLARADLLAATRPSCPESRRSLIAEAFRDDFRKGEVVVVERWVVSRSECIVSGLWMLAGAPAAPGTPVA